MCVSIYLCEKSRGWNFVPSDNIKKLWNNFYCTWEQTLLKSKHTRSSELSSFFERSNEHDERSQTIIFWYIHSFFHILFGSYNDINLHFISKFYCAPWVFKYYIKLIWVQISMLFPLYSYKIPFDSLTITVWILVWKRRVLKTFSSSDLNDN